MAVGLSEPKEILPVTGIKLASIAAGIKKNGSDDIVVISFDETAICVATFTQNAFCAAPVILAKKHLSQQAPRALLINSGNANAGTGDSGMTNAFQSCQWLADELDCQAEQVLPFSTGVIGQQLPMPAFQKGIKNVVANLSADHWQLAAKGIMTTDTVAKGISKTVTIDGKMVTISGIAKGSGMICPDMATMLAFITTDANVERHYLQQCLSGVVEESFNAITVDGDTSTNDACVLIATGKSGNVLLDNNAADADLFISALDEVCQYLAQTIVRDAEGATKFVTVAVNRALSKVSTLR